MSCSWEKCKECGYNGDCENQSRQVPCKWVRKPELEQQEDKIKEWEYFDKDGKCIATLGVPLEEFIENDNNKDKRIFELETGLTQANFKVEQYKKDAEKEIVDLKIQNTQYKHINKAKEDKIKELKKNVDKYKQYKGFFTVCSKELMRTFDEIDRLKEVEQSYETMSKEYASYIENSNKIDNEQQSKNDILKEKIRLLRPILEKYANTKIGEVLSNGTCRIDIKPLKGETTTAYIAFDPRPAKEGIDIIDSIDEV